ncbi:MAG: biotin/lipoyl-containing protein, partial [Ginsengibacter sp.]
MSDTMTEGVIVEWHKKVGDKIKPGDLLAEVETDKATMELESYNEGTLLYIGVEKGKSVAVEGVLAIVGKEGEDYKPLLEGETNNKPTEAKNDSQKKEGDSKTMKNEDEQKSKATEEVKKSQDKPSAELPKDAKVIRMPLLSDTMTEGKIIQWNKKVGDKVKGDDVLAEVETDKATMEVIGYEEGTLLYIGVEAGQAAKVNGIIAIVGKEGTDVSAFVEAEKNQGEGVPADESGKSETQEQPAQQQKASESKALSNGMGSHEDEEVAAEGGRLKASPLAKKLAADKGIDIAKVKGTGDGGRIVKKDVDGYVPAAAAPASVKEEGKKAEPAKAKPVQAFEQTGQESHEDIPNTQMRKTIARRLAESMYQAPHFYLTMEINMDNAITSRVSINEVSPVKISFNDMVIKACALSLRQHPAVNSSWMGDFIRQNKHVHIGSAV